MKVKIGKKHINVKVATSFYDRLTGFIGQTNINSGILFPSCNSIHTYFMKEAIDVIALNERNEIVFKVIALPKNKVFKVNRQQKNTSILELPANSTASLKVGSKIVFENF